ncbi:MAG TPA: hypothetical protein PKY59_25160 [Pyrinomonadaceae bacterium]|nr:hypothetical protein [Pyrinomonadaceae bacterium]
MKTFDYNGSDFWSVDAVLERCESYSKHFKVSSPFDIQPFIRTDGEIRRIYPVMEKVIEGIEKDDSACIEIGIEFIEESRSFPFGKILKYNTARALCRVSTPLSEPQKERIRKRVAEMLCTDYLPREFRQYAKLVRQIGLGNWESKIEREANFNNRWVKHYFKIIKKSF